MIGALILVGGRRLTTRTTFDARAVARELTAEALQAFRLPATYT
ncbi:hypothetical protein [Georgfuchsia toluolica]|nr:hypothetical protein [Georgfuchsia toluolica]